MDAIILRGVKTHNLRNLDFILPHRQLYVITGVSGSGKSSLAFDTLYAEGQRRYVESLSSYARQFLERMEKPDVESVSGIPPAIAIQAKNVITNARSTVGTQTEINDYLRLFFARIGKIICPDCQVEVTRSHPADLSEFLMNHYENQDALIMFRVELGQKGKKYLKESLDELERQGFIDFYHNGKIISGENLLKKNIKTEALHVCIDTIKVSAKSKKRVVDSLELAYRYGKGCVDVNVGKKLFQFSDGLRCYQCARSFKEPTPNLFSFNSPLGACPDCQGFGRVITIDWDLVIPDQNKSLKDGAVQPWTRPSSEWEFGQLLKFCKKKKIPTNKPWKSLTKKHREWVLRGVTGEKYFSVQDFFDYLEKKTYKMHVRVFLSRYRNYVPCGLCQETRLKPESLAVRIGKRHIYDVQLMNISSLFEWLDTMQLSKTELERVEPVYVEVKKRVRFLNEVGLGYLSLARLSRTLSGGEVQRIHLATSLGSALVDTLYVLDEPSVGLHERDNDLLIRLLKELRDLGNTVVVVEHDRTMIESADEVIDLGPGGGETGGRLLFQGDLKQLYQSKQSLTGKYLRGELQVTRRHMKDVKLQQVTTKNSIKIHGASEHNLKNADVTIPLKQFVTITGVSGSGKSTLIYDVLHRHYLRYRGLPVQDLGSAKKVTGFENIDEVILVDQTPIGRSPRSNPVTYVKAYDDIRKIFAGVRQAKEEGLSPSSFSFNVDGGRCDTCKGAGQVKVEMHFLADVFMTCDVCHGKRFKSNILDVKYQGKNIDDVLKMTIDDAEQFFNENVRLKEKLMILSKVGLGYLRLGQSATTLSGGEAQRLKLALEMSNAKASNILYLFDEPTTGLHYHDIHYLLRAFEELLSRGHSLVVIEHNMEVISASDTLIDLGPGGGDEGGSVVYFGPRQGILKSSKSYTGRYLKKYLGQMRTKAGLAQV